MYRFYFNCQRWKPTLDQWIYANRCLPIEEIQRFDEYVFQRDVKFALIGQLLIRYLLNRAFEKKSSSFLVQRTESARPFVQTYPAFDFNLSHRDQLVCIAGTFHGRIGCDTMNYRTKSTGKAILRKKFTKHENELIEKNPQNFSRLWCLKESYVKWLGTGIAFPLLSLNFHLSTEDFVSKEIISDTRLEITTQSISSSSSSSPLRFDEELIHLSTTDQQIITLCLANHSSCQAFVQLNLDDILHGCTPFDPNKEMHLRSWERFQMKK